MSWLGPSEVEAPRPPTTKHRDWRFWVAGVGRTAIGMGVLMLLFVAYQLWGTGLQEARAQSDLSSDFDTIMAATTSTLPTTTTTTAPGATTTAPAAPTTTPSPTTTAPALPPAGAVPKAGQVLARIEIPKIGVDKKVVEGVARDDLQKGPGHYPDTPMLGHLGNAAIAGHRTTFGAPFFRVNELAAGDVITITTPEGHFRYVVTQQLIVSPSDYSVIANTPTATLTLTSCNPRYSAAQRIVIKATLDNSTPALPSPTTVAPPPPTTAPHAGGSTPGSTLPGEVTTVAPTRPASADALSDGWFSDPSAWLPTIFWGLLCLGVAIGAWVLSRRWRRWPSYGAAVLPFLVLLYFFFENMSRLLPPGF